MFPWPFSTRAVPAELQGRRPQILRDAEPDGCGRHCVLAAEAGAAGGRAVGVRLRRMQGEPALQLIHQT